MSRRRRCRCAIPKAILKPKRLIEASQQAREAFIANRRRTVAERRAWACFAAALILPVIFLAFYPDMVVRAAPAAARLYEKAGIKVNIYGLEVRHVQQEHVIVDGIRVLAIKGEIVNVSDVDRKIPALRFGLRSPTEGELYAWTVEFGIATLAARRSDQFFDARRLAARSRAEGRNSLCPAR